MRVRAVVAYSAAAALAAPFLRLLRRSPQERERRRRELIQARGRVIEGYAIGCRDGAIEYTYEWRGVRYEASQDLSDFTGEANVYDDYAGPVTVKFLRDRPANSIVLNEKWSGIPGRRVKA
jgi:hypothetical protein